MALLIIDAGVTLCIVAIKGGGGWHSGLLEDCWFVVAVTSVIAVPPVFSASVCLSVCFVLVCIRRRRTVSP